MSPVVVVVVLLEVAVLVVVSSAVPEVALVVVVVADVAVLVELSAVLVVPSPGPVSSPASLAHAPISSAADHRAHAVRCLGPTAIW